MIKTQLGLTLVTLLLIFVFRRRNTFPEVYVFEAKKPLKYLIFPVVTKGYTNVAGAVFTAINLPIIVISAMVSLINYYEAVYIYLIQDVMFLEAAFIGVVAEEIVYAKNFKEKRLLHISMAILLAVCGVYSLVYIYIN